MGAGTIMVHGFPLHKRPFWGAIIAFIHTLATVPVPLLGGVLIDHFAWRACFGINLPIRVLTFGFTTYYFHSSITSADATLPLKEKVKKMDLLGTFFFVPDVVCLLIALQWGGIRYGWQNARIITLLVLFAGLIGIFGYIHGVLAITEYYIAIYFQGVKGFSATKSGALGLPTIVGLSVSALTAGMLTTALGYYYPLMIVTSITAPVAAGLLTTLDLDESLVKVLGLLGFLGASVGLGLQAPFVAVQTVLDPKDVPIGMAINGFAGGIGSGLFLSASSALFQNGLVKEVSAHAPGTNITVFEQGGLTDICTATANVVWDSHSSSSSSSGDTGTTLGSGSSTVKKGVVGHAYAPANESVLVWDLKTSVILSSWTVANNTSLVTVITRSQTDPDVFAVGYEDGKIRVWDSRTATVIITFNGHKTAVTQLRFDHSGARLASGSKDTDIIIWDLVAEVGLVRLRGHKDQITSLNFLTTDESGAVEDGTAPVSPDDSSNTDTFLLSTSKDALIKVWDLSTQHCIETHVTQTNGECWALCVTRDGTGCITAGNDGEIKVWSIDQGALKSKLTTTQDEGISVLHERGTLYRQGRDKPSAVVSHPKRDIIAIHGSEKAIELFRIRSEKEVRKALMRKRKRRKEKEAEGATTTATTTTTDADSGVVVADEAEGTTDISSATISDIIVPYVTVRTGGKVRSMDWAGSKSGKSFSVLVATANNQLEVFEVLSGDETKQNKKSKGTQIPDYNRTLSIDMPGHRTDIRCVALSSDDRMLATASNGSLKIWNTRTQSCLRTLDCGYALCLAFLPGDKIVVVGTREGTLEVFDIAASTLLDTITAHERDIWALAVQPDGKGLVTGSADKSAKFWDFKVVQEEVLGTNRKTAKLTLVHSRTLKVADDILSVCFSPDSRLLAVSTLDSTVKVFFLDTLKLFLTLYGHKLPVLSMSISHDSKLIATSSADKNVRVWGLDFGDCHKAFFAHQDSILSVAFVPNNNDGSGHHFFSASKDKTIKYYDGDKFEQIQKLDGHHGEIWAMAVAGSGEFLVTASHDKSIRIWAQTDEQIFLEEEREKELEMLYESTLLTSLETDASHEFGADGDGDDGPEATTAGKQTSQTMMAGERISEALELGLEDLRVMRDYEDTRRINPKAALPQRDPVFLANNHVSASVYVLNTLQRIPSASLQDALLVLSFAQLPGLFTFLALWAAEGRNIPLTCRVLFFMLKTHQKQIVSSQAMKVMLEEVRDKLRVTVQAQKQDFGFNLAGLRVLRRRVRYLGESDYVDEATWENDQQQQSAMSRGKKRGFRNVA
ncbi:uncharacterized protein A1O9_04249 [Exophiala aquamarina CBS 119918]|uniref:Small-subunit processome Utp12 domain-containing protein n=1 Tax=Exophiala aquamarina CBS 119918 TaxID=1182545 RepID=A0A072PV30_9EURO|nr:uncharacterized protein A1O9_04249 [Exophiala aquamarina CBS 119918]KEF59405.1 hypothetical protein A1O9_04249 [Exophiala aquamarina CBS 119918]